MNAPAPVEDCGGCHYWLPPNGQKAELGRQFDYPTRGKCQRYPQALEKLSTEWCGEFCPKEG